MDFYFSAGHGALWTAWKEGQCADHLINISTNITIIIIIIIIAEIKCAKVYEDNGRKWKNAVES